jgi:nicotinate-nucleotide--dimethylbenzimidazole phosphoribosyltransferase
LEELAKQICIITGDENPSIENKVIFTLAADHGVVAEGISAYPQEVTAQMVQNFLRGGAGINVLARHVGAKVRVVDIGVAKELQRSEGLISKKINLGTRNITKEPAMTKEEAIRSLEIGIELFEEEYKNGLDIVGLGDMGIGNTTPSSAITALITGANIPSVTGRGTGITQEIFENKIRVIKRAIEFNKPDPQDALDILHKLGGFEIGGIAGIILAASAKRIPVMLDGFISTAGGLLAVKLSPASREYLLASHLSTEPGHARQLEWLGLEPILRLDMRLGEGTGAALGIFIIQAGCRILSEMATFEDAGIARSL